jgi:uncharacterized protein (TIGR00255 family)
MTGYGRGEASAGGVRIEVELSSVNRKQMDISISLPRTLSVLEPRVEEAIHKALSRGRVTGEVFFKLSAKARQRGMRVDADLARAYLRELRRTAKRAGLSDNFGASILLELPDVLRYEQPCEEAHRLWPILSRALSASIENLLKMRVREGATLQRDLTSRFGKLERRIDRIRRQAPAVVKRYREKLLARLKAAGFALEAADDRVLRELALFADRSDITEELTRLDSHLKQTRKLMQMSEPAGRSLDFLAQEMFREVNTLGSKANDGGILKDVVALKAELERVREQVQNIE